MQFKVPSETQRTRYDIDGHPSPDLPYHVKLRALHIATRKKCYSCKKKEDFLLQE